MVFLWCGLHLSDDERRKDPFTRLALIPCKNIECELFREESPFCMYMVTAGMRKWE
jgi:hypothetical protein